MLRARSLRSPPDPPGLASSARFARQRALRAPRDFWGKSRNFSSEDLARDLAGLGPPRGPAHPWGLHPQTPGGLGHWSLPWPVELAGYSPPEGPWVQRGPPGRPLLAPRAGSLTLGGLPESGVPKSGVVPRPPRVPAALRGWLLVITGYAPAGKSKPKWAMARKCALRHFVAPRHRST